MSQAMELSARRLSAGVMPAACAAELIWSLRFAMVMAVASEGATGAGAARGGGRRIGLDGWVGVAVGPSVGAGDDRWLLAADHLWRT